MATIEIDPTLLVIATAVWTALWTTVGWLANHWLSGARDAKSRKHASEGAKKARKGDFLSFLRGWRIEVVRDSPGKTANNFSEKVRMFEEASERITGEYGPPFEDLVQRVSSMRSGEVQYNDGHQQLLERIDAVRDFVKAN